MKIKTKPKDAYIAGQFDAPKRQPMSADTILDKFEELGFSNNSFQLRCFIEGVRWAEKYHGIQGEE